MRTSIQTPTVANKKKCSKMEKNLYKTISAGFPTPVANMFHNCHDCSKSRLNAFSNKFSQMFSSVFVGVAFCNQPWHQGMWCQTMPSSRSPKRDDLETGCRKQIMSPMVPLSMRLMRLGRTSITRSGISTKLESCVTLR